MLKDEVDSVLAPTSSDLAELPPDELRMLAPDVDVVTTELAVLP
jgi:hypothetical protein